MQSNRFTRKSARKSASRQTFLRSLALIPVAAIALVAAAPAMGQGCILARSPEQTGLPTGQGGILQPGHFQFTVAERHQFSFQHYVGDVYQVQRAQLGNQVENRINVVTGNLTYQISPRVSVEIDAPWLFASRKTQNSNIKYEASGLGDTIVGVNSWIFSPLKAHKGNLSLGIGVLAPSGKDDVTNNVNTGTSTAPVNVNKVVDYSIQPGGGGWGMVTQWMGYRRIGKDLTFYVDGDYIATQGDTNGVLRTNPPSTTTPLNNYVAISDQYLLEGGVQFPIRQVKGLAVTFGPRDEGVPAKNLFPNSNAGFRRSGFAVSAGPGAQYSYKSNILTAGIYKAVHRDRTVSYPDSVYGAHGDAAFAQYVWLASATHRF